MRHQKNIYGHIALIVILYLALSTATSANANVTSVLGANTPSESSLTPIISIELPNATVQPQSEFIANINVNPNGLAVYAVQYELTYNISVLKPELQLKQAFLSEFGDTMVIVNKIDHTTGKISYAETLKGPGSVNESGTLASVHFTVIGESGDTSILNLSDVIIVNPDVIPYNPIEIVNASVTIANQPPAITTYYPYSQVTDFETASRTFSITANQPVDVTWAINGTVVQTNKSVIGASYTNITAVVGTWEVYAIVSNSAGSEKQTWLWTVSPLVVPTISIEPVGQFDVNITVNPKGLSVYAVQYELIYNTSVLRPESQEKRAFLGTCEDTLVVVNNISDGKLAYAETIKGPGAVKEPGTLTSIRFIPVGNRGDISNLNLSDVIIVNPAGMQYNPIEIINASVTLNNTPPVSALSSVHRINNAGLWTVCLSACESYDPNALLEPAAGNGTGSNITRIRWDFGDGQSEIREGDFDEICYVEHKYSSWNWLGGSHGHYEPFNASITVTDDGCPGLNDTSYLDIAVYMPGDTNGDGWVNIHDAVRAGKHFGESCARGVACSEHKWSNAEADGADLNNDGVVNIQDAVIIGANWGSTAW